jgi:competence protein ComEC
VILAVFLLVYCTAAGLHPGIIRAALMTTLMFGAFNLRREPDILSALALTAILELLWRPSWIYEFGFQLSFVAVATIALWLPHRSKTTHKPIASRILFVAASVVVMFVAAAPIIAYQTGELNLAAPVVGCLIVPAIPPLVAFGLLGWGLALASPLIAGFWMKLTVAPFAGWVLAASELSGRASGFQIAIPPFNAYVLLPVYVLLAYGSRFTSNAFSGEKTFGERR